MHKYYTLGFIRGLGLLEHRLFVEHFKTVVRGFPTRIKTVLNPDHGERFDVTAHGDVAQVYNAPTNTF